jgi:protein-tyrosine phosphatase
MIDFHNHVLPNVDDGSKNVEMTISMLKSASAQGIKTIVNTTHLQHPKMENKNTNYEYIINIRDEVLDIAQRENIDIDIELAAEVYYLPNLCELIDHPLATFNNFMLIEFPMIITPPEYENTFFQLILKGVTPILAHPERYRGFQDDVVKLQRLQEMGVVFQIDAGSLLGHFGKKTKKMAFEMLSKGYCHLIGSDAHNNAKRNFCLLEAYDIIKSDQNVSILKKNSEAILLGDKNLNSIKLDSNQSFFKILKDKVLGT